MSDEIEKAMFCKIDSKQTCSLKQLFYMSIFQCKPPCEHDLSLSESVSQIISNYQLGERGLSLFSC